MRIYDSEGLREVVGDLVLIYNFFILCNIKNFVGNATGNVYNFRYGDRVLD